MQALIKLLFGRLDLNAADTSVLDGLRNGLSIVVVVLLTSQIRFDVLSREKMNFMAQ